MISQVVRLLRFDIVMSTICLMLLDVVLLCFSLPRGSEQAKAIRLTPFTWAMGGDTVSLPPAAPFDLVVF